MFHMFCRSKMNSCSSWHITHSRRAHLWVQVERRVLLTSPRPVPAPACAHGSLDAQKRPVSSRPRSPALYMRVGCPPQCHATPLILRCTRSGADPGPGGARSVMRRRNTLRHGTGAFARIVSLMRNVKHGGYCTCAGTTCSCCRASQPTLIWRSSS